MTVTAAGAGACLLMGMGHENRKHRSQHFCESHANYDEEDEKEEFWGDESSPDRIMSGGPLASSHYGENLLSDLPSPFLRWLQGLGEKQGGQKCNKEEAETFVHPSLPLPFSLSGDGTPNSAVLDLVVGQKVGDSKEVKRGAGFETSKGRGDTFDVSVRALRGNRLSMEDEYCIRNGGRFAAVFDGHGGGDVSTFLRNQLYDRIESHLKQSSNTTNSASLDTTVSSIRTAFDEIDSQVLKTDKLQYQGSTAVAVYLHRDDATGRQTLISANVGDSRAILSQSGVAVDLTRDHKPDDKIERKRIMDMGEKIEWDDYSGVFRVRNLSLSRAIGDRFAKPVVSGEVEIKVFPLEEESKVGTKAAHDFVVLASDGLWDVMTSQDCVDFVHKRLSPSSAQLKNMSPIEVQRQQHTRRKNMSRFLGNEALRRGSGDNVCIIIVWLDSQC